MTKKVVAALVALIMVFTLMPAGVFAVESPIEIFEGENVIVSATTATYFFAAPDKGFYGFSVPSSNEVPASIVISTVNNDYEGSQISNGSQECEFAAVGLETNEICVVTITYPAETVCTVSRIINHSGGGDYRDADGDYNFWYVFSPQVSDYYVLTASNSSYAYINAYQYSDGKLSNMGLSACSGNDISYTGCFLADEVYYVNVYGHSSGFTFNIESVTDSNKITVTDHALMLSSGDIGVIFNAEVNPQCAPGSYMEFYTGRVGRYTMTSADAYDRSTGKYSFVCPIGAYRMADQITPVFHYLAGGEDKTVTLPSYSVEDYIKYVIQSPGEFDNSVINTVKALNDYGYYSQIYLASLHGFSLGDDGKYNRVANFYNKPYNYYSVLEELSNCSPDIRIYDPCVKKITYSLTLESDISLNIYVETDGTVITAQDGDNELTVKPAGKDRYKIQFTGIKPYELEKIFQFRISYICADIRIMPASYIYNVLDKYSGNTEKSDLCKAVCALYYYGKAVSEIESQTSAGGNGGDEPVPYQP